MNLTEKDGRWFDENNNSWNSKENALNSRLANCYNCIDCASCYNCNYCNNCTCCKNCDSCNYCSYCSYCNNCNNNNYCYYCNYCNYCINCSYCNNFKENPARVVSTPIGSRGEQTTIYWISKNNIQVICGCFRGNIENFKTAISRTHGDNEYSKAYFKFISIVEQLIELGEKEK